MVVKGPTPFPRGSSTSRCLEPRVVTFSTSTVDLSPQTAGGQEAVCRLRGLKMEVQMSVQARTNLKGSGK